MEPDIPYFDSSRFGKEGRQDTEDKSHQLSQSLPTKAKQKELGQLQQFASFKSMENIQDSTQGQATKRKGPRTCLFTEASGGANDEGELGIEAMRSSGMNEENNNFGSEIRFDKESTDKRLEAATAALARARKQQTGVLTNSSREVPVGQEDSGISTMLASGNQTMRNEGKAGASIDNTEALKVSDLFSPVKTESMGGSLRTQNRMHVSNENLEDKSEDIQEAKAAPKHVTINETKNEYSFQIQAAFESVTHLNKDQDSILNSSDKENVNPYLSLEETVEGYSPDFKWNKVNEVNQSFEMVSVPSVDTTPVIGKNQGRIVAAGDVPKMPSLTEDYSSVPSAVHVLSFHAFSSVCHLRIFII